MKHLEIVGIGTNKGAPRVYIEGRKAVAGGFLPGVRYNAKVDADKCLLTLEKSAEGMRIVSRKLKGEKELPVLDLNSHELLSIFSGLDSVRVVIKQDLIHILPVASEIRARRRLQRLRDKVQKNEPLSFASLASGVGFLDMAAHEGFGLAGMDTQLGVAMEIRDDCMEHAVDRNPCFTRETITITAPMQEIAFDPWVMQQLPEYDVLTIGMPCSGAMIRKGKEGA